jgi:hypothetical protein
MYCLQGAVHGDHGEVVSLLLHHGGKVANKEGHRYAPLALIAK